MLAVPSYANDPLTPLLGMEMGKIISLVLTNLPVHEHTPLGTQNKYYLSFHPSVCLHICHK